MKVLLVDDDTVAASLTQIFLGQWDYQAVTAADAQEALSLLAQQPDISFMLVDRVLPGIDGLELTRRIKARGTPSYVILVTSLNHRDDLVEGLEAGADDYLAKPFDSSELKARMQAGKRVLTLQNELYMRVQELEQTLRDIKQLEQLLPICSYCKKVREGENYWNQIEDYFSRRSSARFSHSCCPDCFKEHLQPRLTARLGSLEPH